jgi:tRNA(Ile)-lysidine synthase
MAEAEGLLDELAAADLARCADPSHIPLALLSHLSVARRNNALRHALGRLALPLPGAAQLAELGRALEARHDASALVRWPGVEARVYRQTLYLLPPRRPAAAAEFRLDTATACRVAEGELRLVPADGYGIPDRWARQGLRVAPRAGGERFRPRGHRHHKALKQWFQEQGIVPWMRARVPLIYADDRLVAIADLELADELPHSDADAPFWRPTWTGHAPLR